jgi:hypothetical protein
VTTIRRPFTVPATFNNPCCVSRRSIRPMPAVTFRSVFTQTTIPPSASIVAASS